MHKMEKRMLRHEQGLHNVKKTRAHKVSNREIVQPMESLWPICHGIFRSQLMEKAMTERETRNHESQKKAIPTQKSFS